MVNEKVSLSNCNILTRKEDDNIMYIAITLGEDNNFWLKAVTTKEVDIEDRIYIDDDTNTVYKFDSPVIMT
ncbi:hypothetical protein [Macrococcoides bohemicum]|uniref:hypothetical protein n=1 Tax=Macrococcoides bohemicum TaxID=1903056 RepID=UPI00165E1507|nr:hypothetical protein [Macrococcus bohemicus]MBC9875587.1 hypothetical protein [Macrococcus bohemicus]